VVTHQLQVERRIAKGHRPKTDALPLDYATNRVQNMIVTDIRGGSEVSQISAFLDSTCNKNFDGEFGEL